MTERPMTDEELSGMLEDAGEARRCTSDDLSQLADDITQLVAEARRLRQEVEHWRRLMGEWAMGPSHESPPQGAEGEYGPRVLPTTAELAGSIPGLTGDESTEAYIARIRGREGNHD